MPRPQRPLDPDAGPLQAFAAELRKLRSEAGEPKFEAMARRSGRSKTALTDAAAGIHLPTWETVAAFVRACDDDPAAWRPRWEQVRAQVRDVVEAGVPPVEVELVAVEAEAAADAAHDPQLDREEHDTEAANSNLHGSSTVLPARCWLRLGVPVLLLALLGILAILYFQPGASPEPASAASSPEPASPASGGPAVVVVQNKIAQGPDVLVEDDAPAYLSSEPLPYCASQGCKIEGTEVASGAMLTAICTRRGVEMFNYNLDAPEVGRNPHKVRSDLWYRVAYPDGKKGYLSEVYVEARYRGGLGLPECAPA